MLILLFITPGCHVSVTLIPPHLQVLFEDFQFDGRDSLFFFQLPAVVFGFRGVFLSTGFADWCFIVFLTLLVPLLLLFLVRLLGWVGGTLVSPSWCRSCS